MDEEGFEKRADTGASAPAAGAADRGRGGVRSGTDLAAGLFLLVCGILGWWFGQHLKVGTAYRMGPGYAPMLLSWILMAFGAVMCASGLMRSGKGLERWPMRPILMILGAILLFGFAVERVGLLLCSFAVVWLGSAAAPQPRYREAALWAACLAGLACVLFPIALQLPLRIFPW